jgi:hypothetical protein
MKCPFYGDLPTNYDLVLERGVHVPPATQQP